MILTYLESTYLGENDFAGSHTASGLWEVEQLHMYIERDQSIESKANYRRPLTVEAEIKSSSDRCSISMTLFAEDSGKNKEISLAIGGTPVTWIFYPGNVRGALGDDGKQGVEYWRKVKLELDDSEKVDFYIDNEHKYSDTSSQKEGKLRFVAGCKSMMIKNINIGKYSESI